MKIYISGAITDNPYSKEQFQAAEDRLKAQGHTVINPFKNQGDTYKEYIDTGLFQLMHCEAIYLLKGYEKSTGATLEHDYARTVGLKIMLEEDEQKAAAIIHGKSLEVSDTEINNMARFLHIAEQLGGNVKIDPQGVRLFLKLIKKAQRREIITDYGFKLCPHCERDVNEYEEYCSLCGQHLN